MPKILSSGKGPSAPEAERELCCGPGHPSPAAAAVSVATAWVAVFVFLPMVSNGPACDHASAVAVRPILKLTSYYTSFCQSMGTVRPLYFGSWEAHEYVIYTIAVIFLSLDF